MGRDRYRPSNKTMTDNWFALFVGLVFLLTQESKTGSPDGSADHYADSNPQPNIAGQCPDNGTQHYATTDADADCFISSFGFST